jgi:membrane protease YdiL (CAAX protease family)
MTGKSILDMKESMTDPANSDAVKVIQSVTAIIGFLFPAIFTAFLLNRKPFRLLGFTGKINWKQVSLVFMIIIFAVIVSGFLSYINEQIPLSSSWRLKFEKMEKDYMQEVQAIIGLDNPGQFLLSIVIMAFLPALCEETLFRGGLQNFLTRWTNKPWVSIVIVSILFSAFHFSYYGFLSRLFLGIVLGLLYHYSGRLWLSVIAHFLNNAFAITMLYVYKLNGKPAEDAMGDTSGATWWGLLALPLLIFLLISFKKVSPQPPKDDPRREELRDTIFY